MMSRKTLFLSLLLLLGTIQSIFGQEYYRIGRSHRALAMGNTGIASANDSSALYYNPAAMANIRTWWWDVAAFGLEYTEGAKNLYQEIATNKGLKFDNASEADAFFQDYQNSYTYARATVGSHAIINLSTNGLTVGGSLLTEIMLSMDVPELVTDPVKLYERWDSIQQTGISIPIGVGQFIVGVGYKTIHRRVLDAEYTIGSPSFPDFPDDASEDTGKGYDYGFLYRAATPWRLSVGVVVQNNANIDLGKAGEEKQEVSAGISISPEYGIFRWTLAVDYRDMFFNFTENDEDRSSARRLHVGTELGIFPVSKTYSVISLRAGYNQGYLSRGAEVNFGHGTVIGYAEYSEETGLFPDTRESKRTIWYLSFGF